VRSGDKLVVRNEVGEFQVDGAGAEPDARPAETARALYCESEASREAAAKAAAERKAMQQYAPCRASAIEAGPAAHHSIPPRSVGAI